MKKEYSMLIKIIKKKNTSKYLFLAFLLLAMLISLAFLPIQCEPVTGGYVMLENKKVSVRRCTNIYGLGMSVPEIGE